MSFNSTKIVIPTCQKCSGFLNIKIIPSNFSIEYECKNYNSHKDKNIYFKTFERFYLKENELKHCSNCEIILENSEFFECNICKKTYCSQCYIKDIQENGHKYKDNNYTNNRCQIHNNDKTEYCFNCNKNICISCSMNDDEHKNHRVIYYHNCMPSDKEIESLKIKIKEKSTFYEILIKKIDEWNKKMTQKIEELKQNLRDEISLLKKIVFNFNSNFRNYTYFEIFNYINNSINNTTNNQYLLEFYNCVNFEKETEILMTIFKYMGRNASIKQNKKGYPNTIQNNVNYKFIQKIDENNFIGYNELNKTLYFLYFGDIIYSIYKEEIKENIYSISKSTLENKIFICLSNKKVKIIDYDFDKKVIKYNEIKDNNIFNNNYNPNYYYKCIQLSAGLYATSDNNITIWSWSIKDNIYIKIKNINGNSAIYDMILLDKDNFMCTSSFNQNLNIYNIQNFSTLKVIQNIDCRSENNSLLKVDENFILINCFKGIAIFDIKCKEIIQYTQEYYSELKTIITLDSFNKIYISHINSEQYKNSCTSLFGNLNNTNRTETIIKIYATEINNGEIILSEEYENIKIEDTVRNMLCFNKEILIFGNNTYKIGKNNYLFGGLFS